ncbi:MAG: IS5 family transposase [Desulfobacteraceae bacterium]|nr:IS5 family transposase [Desulfobacteraceae bacterium]
MNRHTISDEKWEHIKPILSSPKKDTRGRKPKDNRPMFNGILWILKTGAPWRDLPKTFGPWQTVYKRFAKWTTLAAWTDLFDKLVKDVDTESSMIDGSYVKLHQHGCGAQGGQYSQAIGRSKGGLTTKIHAVVDGLGNPLRIKLTGGNVSDIKPSFKLISGIKTRQFLADKAYDADKLIELAESTGCKVIIPPKINRKVQRKIDKHIYKERHLVECFFAKIKSYRRVSTRYEKLASRYHAMVVIASCLVWLQ